MRNKTLTIYIEGTLFAALAMVMSLIPSGIGSSYSVSLGMIPLTFYAVRRGFGPGVFAGFLWGALHFVTGSVYMLNVYQVIIEYTITYASIGLAGAWSSVILERMQKGRDWKVYTGLAAAVCFGSLGRYFWHFIAGWIFWGDYAMWDMGAFTFSLLMNGLSMVSTALITILALFLIYSRSPKLFLPKIK